MNIYRNDFPIYKSSPELVYLDSAATTLKPQIVIDKVSEYYQKYSSNIHRGLYPIAQKASYEYENSRQIISNFINSQSPEQIIFTKGATDALNLLATSLSGSVIRQGVEVLTTIVEHHANFVPWQQAAIKNKAKFGVITFDPLHSTKKQIIEAFRLSITNETAILTLTYVSNVLGLVLPISEIISLARSINPQIIIVVDACQAIQHIPIDTQQIDCDFLVFSGHKCFGPTGVGVLYGKRQRLEELTPYQYGGDMIEEVTIEKTTFAKIPNKFEAGTPPIAEVIGLGTAISYISNIGLKTIDSQCKIIHSYAIEKLESTFGHQIEIYGKDDQIYSGIVSFNMVGCHPHDVAQIVGDQNVCIRVGHHCAQPLHSYLNIPATCRMSFSLYNTHDDIDKAILSFQNVLEVLRPHIV